MRLKKVCFDAYKSLLSKELNFSNNCIGIVGINESGKSNVLRAINTLSNSVELQRSDSPKWAKKENPCVKFEFELTKEEKGKIDIVFNEWKEKDTNGDVSDLPDDLQITYNVLFDREENKEIRSFSFNNLDVNECECYLRTNVLTDGYSVICQDKLMPLSQAVVLSEDDIEKNEQMHVLSLELVDIDKKILEQMTKIEGIESVNSEAAGEDKGNDGGETAEKAHELRNDEVITAETDLIKLRERREDVINRMGGFDHAGLLMNARNGLSNQLSLISSTESQLEKADAAVKELNDIEDKTAEQILELSKRKRFATKVGNSLKSLEVGKCNTDLVIESLEQPLREKYSTDKAELSKRISDVLGNEISLNLPKVVLWEHSNTYVLKDEYTYDEIIEAEKSEDISRPLFNLFMISNSNVKTLKDIQNTIEEVQEDTSERLRVSEMMDTAVNNYLKKVWPDYDQKIKISLERDRIVVNFFDPAWQGSYYGMRERSQGAQSFISFLLTIGAEAIHGAITNTVLLLDEPETHLHPSGVRYMLKELIKAADKGNFVVYATHSPFMIDRDNYERHVILTKKHEKTDIKPSEKNRVGYFMQEEVLYKAIDIDLHKDFTSTGMYNFVFEGDGDATIFQKLYSLKKVNEMPFKLDQTSFYQGGKCSDIMKYLKRHPIQLGSKWVFIIDNDRPANDLVKFINSKYGEFVNKYIYIFQYNMKDGFNVDVEFENLLPEVLINDAISMAAKSVDLELDDKSLQELIDGRQTYIEKFKCVVDEMDSNKDLFKSEFKSCINKLVSDYMEADNEFQILESKFPEYVHWFNEVLEKIGAAEVGEEAVGLKVKKSGKKIKVDEKPA